MNPLAKRVNTAAFKALGQDVVYRDTDGTGPAIPLRILEKNIETEVEWRDQQLPVGFRLICVVLDDVTEIKRGDRFDIDAKEYAVCVKPKKDHRKGLWICDVSPC